MNDKEKIKELLRKLFNSWGGWNTNKKYYLNTLLPGLLDGSENSPSDVVIIGNIKQIKERQGRVNIHKLALEVLVEIEDAYKNEVVSREKADNERLEVRRQERLELVKKREEQERLRLIKAEEQERENRERRQQRIAKLSIIKEKRMEIVSLLTKHLYKDADTFYYENETLFSGVYDEEEFEKEKAIYISKYLKNTDTQQTNAIGAYAKNVLVSARAGSGKTHTISGKVAYLCDTYGVRPDEVLVLCFNKTAAENMKSKIVQLVPQFENAMTFHSWAWSIVKPEDGSVMFDNKGEFNPKKYSDFIKGVIEEYSKNNTKFKEEVYNFFKEESEEVDESVSETKVFTDMEERYHYLRNRTFTTLSGCNVKSRGEKWIADFLFEHGIEFYYEQQLGWGKIAELSYHPDFTIKYNGNKYILEHWGIDENDYTRSVPQHWSKTWVQYREEMNKKREFFAEKEGIGFIETSIKDIDYALPLDEQRQAFEAFLTELLVSKGIGCKKLPKDELVEKAWEIQLFTRLNGLMGQFVGWMQKKGWNHEQLQNELETGAFNDKQKHFCSIGLAIYDEYLNKLNVTKSIDFNILISRATQMIQSGEYDVSRFKYILIDEFQDFSKLFQNLVDAVGEINTDIKLFCVGDSWQLINGFAGSDLHYFDAYKQQAKIKTISTCYRSERAVIRNGNNFADKYNSVFTGERSKYYKHDDGFVCKVNIKDTWIESDSRSRDVDDEYKKPFRKNLDRKIGSSEAQDFMTPEMDIQAKYLKKSVELVEKHPDRSFLFLSRNTKVNGLDISEFRDNLIVILKNKGVPLRNEKEQIKFNTMHASKGLEADVVLLLNVCEKVLPSIHPSNELFEIFGRTAQKVLDEEKRLFYVAITRAKERLYILTEEGKESEFIY